jgi:hypothetical protein
MTSQVASARAVVRAALLAVLLGGCHRTALDAESPISPAEWDSASDGRPPCVSPALTVNASEAVRSWALRAPAGTLVLPSAFREMRSPSAGTQRWSAPDSSVLELEGSATPSGGLAADGSAQITLEGQCALPVGGHVAETMRLRMTDTVSGRSRFAASGAVVLRPDQSLNLWIAAPTEAGRERLLAAVRAIRLR